MHLRRLKIQNFRAIDNIDVQFDGLVNVIIGPNAIGKTTILEAIRLNKGILAPRTSAESQQTMFSIGMLSPHMPNRLLSRALTVDPTKPTSIKCQYEVTSAELGRLDALLPGIAQNIALQNIGQNFSNPAQTIGFLNSPQGQQALSLARSKLSEELTRVRSTSNLNLNLIIDHATFSVNGENVIQQALYGSLEQALDPTKTSFSYFPADRAMPTGEQPVQLGMADTSQQLESYNSQPQLKYNRLKNMIFNTIIGSPTGRDELADQFTSIFEKVLKGRRLGEIGVNEIGMLSIPIIDTDTGRSFDIDGLSSGEKGLILTTLLIARSISDNGLILLDEPELHLNPAVCRDLLQFFVDEFAGTKNIQAIICSHSAEILAGAFERPNCSLFHLRSGTDLSKVRQQDQEEIRDALRRLGSSESEALLYKGTISVEGIHDVEILQSAFDKLTRRYKVKPRGGRTIVEADIRDLQKAEAKGDEIGFHYFLFDHDGRPTTLANTAHVKLEQLKRFCLENYLLDAEIITDLSREPDFSDNPFKSPADANKAMKELAMSQLNRVAAREIFGELGLQAICFDMKVLDGDAATSSAALWQRVGEMRRRFDELSVLNFEQEFVRRVQVKKDELEVVWEDGWRDRCNGKKVLEGLRNSGRLKGDILRIKRRIAAEMSAKSTESHSALQAILNGLLQTS